MDLKRIYVVGAIFLIVSLARGQMPMIHFSHLTPREGLTHMAVFDILEDQDGYIWFASQMRLDRYDGKEFIHFQNIPDDSNSLSNNLITALLQDKEGYIWIGTNGGLNRFDPVLNQFRHYKPGSMKALDIWGLVQDSSGTLWMGTLGQGLFRFDPQTEKFTHFTHDPEDSNSLSHLIVRALAVDRDGGLWIGTLGGLDKLVLTNTDTNSFSPGREQATFSHYRHHPQNPSSLRHNAIESLYIDREGRLWVGTSGGGLNQLIGWEHIHASDTGASTPEALKKRPVFKHYLHDPDNPNSLSSNFVTTILEDSQGRMWIGTASRGISILSRDGSTFYNYRAKAADPQSLSDDFVNKIIEDRAGNIWIATQEGGVNQYSPYNQKFTHLLTKSELPEGLERNNLNAAIEDENGDLWVSFIGYGLAKYDRKRRKVIDVGSLFYQHSSKLRIPTPAICRDAAGIFWLGTWGDGIRRFDPKTHQITFYRHNPNDPNSLSDDRIIGIFPRSDGTIWITTQSGGLNRFDPATNTFTRFSYDPADSTSISSNLTHSMCEDRNGSLWVSTLGGGINQLIEDTLYTTRNGHPVIRSIERKFRRYQHDPQDTASLIHDLVMALHADSHGNLWIGTPAGLDKLDIEKGTFHHYSKQNGYPFALVTHIQEDSRGTLWVLTTNGLIKFNEQGLDETGKQFRIFDFTDGLGVALLPTVPSATWRSSSGEIYLAGYDGLTTFYPDQIKLNPYVPPVQITKFSIFGHPVPLDTNITFKKTIYLTYDQNTFTFEFAALNYVQPHKNQYAYQLEGLDPDWVYCDNRHVAHYTNVPPGEYTFRVKGSNNDGVWNEQGALVRIIITPPWWRTGWAYAGYILLIALILFSIRRFEMNRLHLRHQLKRREFEALKLQEIDEMKSRFFANISHEFRTPLTLILGPLETLLSNDVNSKSKQLLYMVRRNALRLQHLINQLLALSKLQAGRMTLRVRRVNLAAFLRTLVMAFASLAESKQIQLSFKASSNEIWAYVDRDAVEKIITNLLSNAFKYTPERGKIMVTVGRSHQKSLPTASAAFVKTNEFVEVVVNDTGTGIPADKLPHIFDRFYQVDNAGSHAQKGTGIGLSLVKELVELHHGRIEVSSTPGQGSTFSLYLPFGNDLFNPEEIVEDEEPVDRIFNGEIEDAPASEGEIHPVKTTSDHAPLVLIVEDNADMRCYIRGHLECDYRIIEAQSGRDGFECAVAEIPDLIISDVMIPEIDGFTLCQKLKSDPRTGHIPVILLTARASGESKIEGLETGADDYIIKPFDVKELLVRVKNLIDQRKRLREQFQREFIMEPGEVEIISADNRFLQRSMEVVQAHLDDPDFTVEQFTRELGMSPMQLHRKLKALTGQSASGFIRLVRLKHAAQLIEKGYGNISEIAYEVGFNNPSYFAARFREVYGMSPKAYATQKQLKREKEIS